MTFLLPPGIKGLITKSMFYFAKIEARRSLIILHDLQYLRGLQYFQSAYAYKSFSILINSENFPLTRRFPSNRSQLDKHLPCRTLKEWETPKIVFSNIKTVFLDDPQKPKAKDQAIANVLLHSKYESYYKQIHYITKTEKRGRASGVFI